MSDSPPRSTTPAPVDLTAPVLARSFADSHPAAPTILFVPAATQRRRADGWTPARQAGFIGALMRIGLVSAAARHVGMSPKSAYALLKRDRIAEWDEYARNVPRDAYGFPIVEPVRDKADDEPLSFAEAWELALEIGHDSARSDAIDRAINGTATPIFYGGRQVGERRTYNDALLIAALESGDTGLHMMTPVRANRRGRPRPHRNFELSPEQLQAEHDERMAHERRLHEQGYYDLPRRQHKERN